MTRPKYTRRAQTRTAARLQRERASLLALQTERQRIQNDLMRPKIEAAKLEAARLKAIRINLERETRDSARIHQIETNIQMRVMNAPDTPDTPGD